MPTLEYKGRKEDGQHAWRVRMYPPGGTKQMSRTFRTPTDSKRAAQRILPKILLEMQNEAEARREHEGTVAQLVNDWLRTKGRNLSPSTIEDYERWGERIKDRFGTMQLRDLKGSHIDAWYSDLMASGQTAANVLHGHRIVRAVLTFGYKRRGGPPPATVHCEPPSYRSPELRPPTTEFLGQLAAGLTGEGGRAMLILIGTGIRRGEVVGLRWEDWDGGSSTWVRHSILDRKGGGVHVKVPKGKREHPIDLMPVAVEALRQQREFQDGIDPERKSPWVFPAWRADITGQSPRQPAWVSTYWNRYRAEHGAESVRPHDIRHWFATTALAAGVPVHTIQNQYGHAQPSTTMNIYGHGTDQGRDAMRQIMSRQIGSDAPAQVIDVAARAALKSAYDDESSAP